MNQEAVQQITGIIQSEIRGAMGMEMQKLNNIFNDLKTEITTSLDTKIETKVNEAIQEVKENVKDLNNKDQILEQKIVRCEAKVNAEMKRRNLIVHGLGALQGWKERESAIFNLFQNKMKVTCKNEDIDSIIKLDKKRDDGPILVKFTTIRKKLEILANRKNLSNTNIYVDEDYSKEVVEKRKELKKVLKQLKNEGKKNVHLKRDELWVDGVLWTGDQTTQTIDSDIVMEDGLAQQELKNTGNKKRGRSPSEATGQKNRKPKKAVPIRSQTTISKFFNSSLEPRQRSSSAGPNLGPEVAKIVDKLTPKDSKENQSQPKGKETQHAATIPNKEEKKAKGTEEGNASA